MLDEASEPHSDVFEEVIGAFAKAGVLGEMVLIGSWCLLLYKHHFGKEAVIPAVRTTDMDILVLNPKKRMPKVSVSGVLTGMGFHEDVAWATGYRKYNREGFVVEFLMPLRGDGAEQVLTVEPLSITVQGLRYLNYQPEELMLLDYKGLSIRAPRPELYTLYKFIVHAERKNPLKRDKDLQTAQQMARFLMDKPETLEGLKWAYSRLSKKEQRKLMAIVQDKAPMLHAYFLQG
jgi:hypothetical protein